MIDPLLCTLSGIKEREFFLAGNRTIAENKANKYKYGYIFHCRRDFDQNNVGAATISIMPTLADLAY